MRDDNVTEIKTSDILLRLETNKGSRFLVKVPYGEAICNLFYRQIINDVEWSYKGAAEKYKGYLGSFPDRDWHVFIAIIGRRPAHLVVTNELRYNLCIGKSLPDEIWHPDDPEIYWWQRFCWTPIGTRAPAPVLAKWKELSTSSHMIKGETSEKNVGNNNLRPIAGFYRLAGESLFVRAIRPSGVQQEFEMKLGKHALKHFSAFGEDKKMTRYVPKGTPLRLERMLEKAWEDAGLWKRISVYERGQAQKNEKFSIPDE